MQTSKLNLAQFKTKAETVNYAKILEKISGGATDDCHCRRTTTRRQRTTSEGTVIVSLYHGPCEH